MARATAERSQSRHRAAGAMVENRRPRVEAGAARLVGIDTDRLGRSHLSQRRRGARVFLWCIDRTNGSLRWKRPLSGANRQIRKQNMSSPSPVTDGDRVWAMTGTGILKAFDFDGNERWARDIQRDYGPFGQLYGYGSSPLLFEDSLYVQVLHGSHTDAPSYLLRIRKSDGKTIWRVERRTPADQESPDAYTTPTLARHGGTDAVVVSGADVVTGHDPSSGAELWRAEGLNPNRDGIHRIIASAVVHDDVIYAPSRERPMLALKAGGRGDVSGTHVLWRFMSGPDVPTPVTDGTYLYVINDRGIMWCLDAKTGAAVYERQRLRPATYTGSPVLADGKIYITDEDGVTSVVQAGPRFAVLAENDFGEYTSVRPPSPTDRSSSAPTRRSMPSVSVSVSRWLKAGRSQGRTQNAEGRRQKAKAEGRKAEGRKAKGILPCSLSALSLPSCT